MSCEIIYEATMSFVVKKRCLSKTLNIFVILLCLLTVSIGFGLETASYRMQSFGRISFLSPLHVDGKYLKDLTGNIVYLRGINKDGFNYDSAGWWVPEGYPYSAGYGKWDPNAVKANLDAMRSWGFNVLRLPFALDLWIEDHDGTYRQHIEDVVTWAGERELYVILALHTTNLTEVQPPLPFKPYSSILTVDEFVEMWVSIAERFKDQPNVLLEFYNEPHPPALISEWIPVVQRCVDLIRNVTDVVVVVQWGWHADLTWVKDNVINGSNILYSGHLYRHWNHMGPEKPYEYNDVKQWLLEHDWQYIPENLSLPLILGEIGIYLSEDKDGLESTWMNNTLKIMNEWKISYLGWHWFTSVRETGMLENTLYIPPPNYVGQMLIDAIHTGST